MINRVETVSSALREAVTAFIVPIQTTRIINDVEFEKMHRAALELTTLLKGQDLVSKSLLNEFYAVMQILRAEAPYFDKDKEKLQEMADKIETCLGLILEDESNGELVPGVPRII